MVSRLKERPVVAVVGATGAVGRVMLHILRQRGFPAERVIALASARSEGAMVPFGEDSLVVAALSVKALHGVDLVLLDTPDEVAMDWAPVAVKEGAVVVDNSAAWRMDDGVPLVVPEVNPKDALEHSGIIASPNCTTVGVVVPLGALHLRFGLRRVIVSSYQATSGAGSLGVEELREQTQKMVGEVDALVAGGAEAVASISEAYAAPIAFNLIPQIGSVKEQGFTSEEWKLTFEARKILGLPDLLAIATCVRVPTFVGHGASVWAEFDKDVDMSEAAAALAQAPGVELAELPNPHSAVGTDPCYVGRLRPDPGNKKALCFFTVSDNLRKGAALNAVQIAELLLP